jgi:hypothetical protein
MFDPMMIPREAANEIMPAFTSPTVITVVAVLDWTSAVTIAPAIVPRRGVLVNFWIRARNFSPAATWNSRENCSIPYNIGGA